ncbi:MAG: hypothetical protein H6739_39805 [Alphaproteobacteria bacterium]|nr:hypothetical protein [Alphaproteobacteria bacterium]
MSGSFFQPPLLDPWVLLNEPRRVLRHLLEPEQGHPLKGAPPNPQEEIARRLGPILEAPPERRAEVARDLISAMPLRPPDAGPWLLGPPMEVMDLLVGGSIKVKASTPLLDASGVRIGVSFGGVEEYWGQTPIGWSRRNRLSAGGSVRLPADNTRPLLAHLHSSRAVFVRRGGVWSVCPAFEALRRDGALDRPCPPVELGPEAMVQATLQAIAQASAEVDAWSPSDCGLVFAMVLAPLCIPTRLLEGRVLDDAPGAVRYRTCLATLAMHPDLQLLFAALDAIETAIAAQDLATINDALEGLRVPPEPDLRRASQTLAARTGVLLTDWRARLNRPPWSSSFAAGLTRKLLAEVAQAGVDGLLHGDPDAPLDKEPPALQRLNNTFKNQLCKLRTRWMDRLAELIYVRWLSMRSFSRP